MNLVERLNDIADEFAELGADEFARDLRDVADELMSIADGLNETQQPTRWRDVPAKLGRALWQLVHEWRRA